MSETPDVRVGQVWADNDNRSTGRHLIVVDLLPAEPADPHRRTYPARAVVALCTRTGQVIRVNGKDTRSKIAITRFRLKSNGYRLVKDVPATVASAAPGE